MMMMMMGNDYGSIGATVPDAWCFRRWWLWLRWWCPGVMLAITPGATAFVIYVRELCVCVRVCCVHAAVVHQSIGVVGFFVSLSPPVVLMFGVFRVCPRWRIGAKAAIVAVRNKFTAHLVTRRCAHTRLLRAGPADSRDSSWFCRGTLSHLRRLPVAGCDGHDTAQRATRCDAMRRRNVLRERFRRRARCCCRLCDVLDARARTSTRIDALRAPNVV